MKPITYARATDAANATAETSKDPQSRYLAGGTNILDLMKYSVENPDRLIDVSRLPMSDLSMLSNGGVLLGGMMKNSDTAAHAIIRERYPVLSEAILAGATGQIRNMASNGGNLLQRTRCHYFYDIAFKECNKRNPGSGCAALNGINRAHAVLGASEKCIATHPSDMCIALAALDAVVVTSRPNGETRRIPFTEFHLLPGNTPQIETVLERGELITGIELPPASAVPFAAKSHYLKVRDRASYAFALVSVASALQIENGVIKSARLVLGGVAHKPWRSKEAEVALVGKPANTATYKAAAEIALKGAKTYKHNAFKVPLAKQTIIRALEETASMKEVAA